MKIKISAIKHIIIFTVVAIAAMAVIIIQTNKAGIQKQKEDQVIVQKSLTDAPEGEKVDDKAVNGTRNIYMYSVDRDLRYILTKYAAENWDFPYNINFYADDAVYYTSDIINITSDKLVNDPSSLDMYCVPSYARNFINGELSDYACTYKELGIDVDAGLVKADIPQCIIDNGSNAEGEIVALPYLATVSVFTYRRSVAKEVWGTDDPNEINGIIGGGTESWECFKQAALTLKEHGYYIVPGFRDVFSVGHTSPLGSDGDINPQWKEYMDVSKYLYDKGYIKDTEAYTEQWYKDLDGEGDKIFGYVTYTDLHQYLNLENTAGDWAICMSPSTIVNDFRTGILVNKNSPNKDILGPFIEWVALDSSKTGLQYRLATGTYIESNKLSVISGTVLKNADSSRDILGGQNINPIVYEALNKPSIQTEITDRIMDYYYWEEAIKAYLWGGKDKETVIEEYKIATDFTPPQ